MADHRQESDRDRTGWPAPGGDLADEVERARTPRTPFLALGGVWLTVAVVVAVVVAVTLLAIYLA
jgi:hypothetical protein